MRLVTFSDAGPPRVGLVAGDEVIDLSGAAPRTMLEFLDGIRWLENPVVDEPAAEVS
jgi:hypothetical protein